MTARRQFGVMAEREGGQSWVDLVVRQRMKKLVQRVPFPFCVARFVVGEEGVYLIRFALVIEGHRLYILFRRFPMSFAYGFDVVGRLPHFPNKSKKPNKARQRRPRGIGLFKFWGGYHVGGF